MEWLDQVFTFVVILTLIILYLHKKFSFWTDHGIPQPRMNPFIGHFRFETKNQISLYAQLDNYYKTYKNDGPFIGLYYFTSPVVLLSDLDFIKTVYIKNFDHFMDNGQYYNREEDFISAHLFNLEGERWRKLRSCLSPTFTSSKMKIMFPNILKIADNNLHTALEERVDKSSAAGIGLPIRELMSCFTTDVIGDCAFGLQCNSFTDPDNQFRKMGTLSFQRSVLRTLKVNLMTLFPKVARFLKMKRIRPEVSQFYSSIVTQAVEYREKNGVERNDFLNLLLELKNNPKVGAEQLNLLEVIAQSFVFFNAGFETSSTTLTFCLYELAVNEEIQEKLRGHITEVVKRHGGEFNYEAMQEMTYLDRVIKETLRKYPILTVMQRVVSKDYKVEDTDIVLKRGTLVLTPVHSIQNDPEVHLNPDKFDPERFNPESNLHPCSFLGFGTGPRNCIGERFGMMQMKIGLVRMLMNYRFERAIDTPVPMKLDMSRPTLAPHGGVPLKVTRII